MGRRERSVSVSLSNAFTAKELIAWASLLGTLWCVEALTRAGQYDPALLQRAVNMFEVGIHPQRFVRIEELNVFMMPIGFPTVWEPCASVH